MANTQDNIDMISSQAQDYKQMAKDKAREVLEHGKRKFQETRAVVSDKSRVVAEKTNQYVQDNPWKVVGAAALAGLIIGLMFRKSFSEES